MAEFQEKAADQIRDNPATIMMPSITRRNTFAVLGALCRHHGLSIDIHRDAGICVKKKFLDYFDVFSVVLEQRCIAVPECMPANSHADEGFADVTETWGRSYHR